MATVTLRLKLPFLDQDRVKTREFERPQKLNIDVANQKRQMPKEDRSKLRSEHLNYSDIEFMWVKKQRFRSQSAITKVKRLQEASVEVNNQGWRISYFGSRFCINLVPLEKVPAAHTSKTCCSYGVLDNQQKHQIKSSRCGCRGQADFSALGNISIWVGLSCLVVALENCACNGYSCNLGETYGYDRAG